jgi:hypothetical protein
MGNWGRVKRGAEVRCGLWSRRWQLWVYGMGYVGRDIFDVESYRLEMGFVMLAMGYFGWPVFTYLVFC